MLNSLVKCQRNMLGGRKGMVVGQQKLKWLEFHNNSNTEMNQYKSLWWKHSRHANHRKQKIRRSVQICIPVSARHVKLRRHQVSQNFKVEVEILEIKGVRLRSGSQEKVRLLTKITMSNAWWYIYIDARTWSCRTTVSHIRDHYKLKTSYSVAGVQPTITPF